MRARTSAMSFSVCASFAAAASAASRATWNAASAVTRRSSRIACATSA